MPMRESNLCAREEATRARPVPDPRSTKRPPLNRGKGRWGGGGGLEEGIRVWL